MVHFYRAIKNEKRSSGARRNSSDYRPGPRHWSSYITHPLIFAVIIATSTLSLFLAGFYLGRTTSYGENLVPTEKPALLAPGSNSSSSGLLAFPELMPTPLRTVFDTLRNLPPVDLYTEYGLDPAATNLYPEPLGKKICIVNIDTREWDVNEGLPKQSDLGWSWLNHYLYGKCKHPGAMGGNVMLNGTSTTSWI